MTTPEEPQPGSSGDIGQEPERRWAAMVRAWVRGERRALLPLSAVRDELAAERDNARPALDRPNEGN